MKDLAGKGKKKKFVEENKYHEWYIWNGPKYVCIWKTFNEEI